MWELLGESGAFNEAHFLLLGSWGGLVLGLLGLGCAVVLVLSYLDLRELRPRWRAHALLGLRTAVLALGVVLLLEPALELRDVERERNHVVFLADGSRSMTVRTPGGATRQQRVSEAIGQLEALHGAPSADHVFDFFVFGGDVQRSSAGGVAQGAVANEVESTRIRESLEEVEAQIGRAALAGVVLLSDGTDHGVLGGRNPDDEALDDETAAYLARLRVPIHVLAAARREGLRDVAIEAVLHDEFAFVRNRVAFDVALRGLGVSGTGVQVDLWQDGERVRTQQVSFDEEDQRRSLTFEVVPERLGKSVYSVVVSAVEGEAIEENNRYHFAMKVIRDKIRVLQVCGRPSWDERFLRRLLKENPNVDLISFFILRTNSDLQLVPQNELSLIPFPKDELFDEELPGFDLVIFQNFDFGPYVYARYLDKVASFVRGGGGFAMVGGDLSFSHGGYYGTPIAEVLPVELYAQGGGEGLLSTEYFRPELTEAGRRHPITKLAFDPQENRRLWESLPLLEGTNVVRGLRAGSTALATHPQLRGADGRGMPVVAVAEVGDGRSLSLTTDASWLWSFENTGRGGTSRPYTNFWNNAIRWLIQDPELKLVKVEVPEQVAPGHPALARVKVLEPDYSPAVGVEGTLRVTRLPLEEAWSEAEAVLVVEDVPFRTDGQGAFELSVATDQAGVYRVHAEVAREGQVAEDEDLLLVAHDSPELRDVAPRNDLLRRIARATGGRYVELPSAASALQELEFAPPRVTRINRRKLVTLWDSGWLFGILGGLLALEWLARRRWGRL